MRRILVVLCFAIFALIAVRPVSAQSLHAFVDSLLSQKSLTGSSWSILAYLPSRDSVLVEYESERLLMPASVVKMITAAAATDRLGTDHRFETRFFASRPVSADGTLSGDLIVHAGGDPSAEMKSVDSLRATLTENIADSLHARGLRRIEGDIRLAARAYRLECAPSAWEIGDIKEGFAPAVDGFGFNNNVCQLAIFPGPAVGEPARLSLYPPFAPVELNASIITGEPGADNWADYYITPCRNDINLSGSISLDDDGEYIWIPVQDPARYYGAALRESLLKRGIEVVGGVHVERPGANGSSLGAPYYVHVSAPLGAVLSLMNKDSDNYSAEYVLRALGIDRVGSGSAEAGMRAVQSFLSNNGIAHDEIRLVDGCGLARRNLCCARGLVEILTVMDRHRESAEFKHTLSHSGIDGTLDYRMSGELAGRVRAKTGTMTYVSTISGYLTLASGEDVCFAIMCNNFHASRHHVRGVQDRIIERIYDEFNKD